MRAYSLDVEERKDAQGCILVWVHLFVDGSECSHYCTEILVGGLEYNAQHMISNLGHEFGGSFQLGNQGNRETLEFKGV